MDPAAMHEFAAPLTAATIAAPETARRLRRARVMYIVCLAAAGAFFLAAIGYWQWMAETRPDMAFVPTWRTFRYLTDFVLIALILAAVANDRVRQLRLLLGLTVTIDADGISWAGARTGSSRWEELGHVIVSKNPKKARRLWLVGPKRWIPNANRSTFTSALMRISRVEGLLLDAPIDNMTHSADEIVAAIQNASGGRFPDASRDEHIIGDSHAER